MTRPYHMKIRAERQADTHRRILEAATRLHRTRGLERTTISDIARLAGVEPPTVTRHFPDRASLVIACLTPGLEQVPAPRPDDWAEIVDPQARLVRALTAVYAHYRRNRVFLSVLADETNTEFAPARKAGRPMLARAHAVLAEGWPVSESVRPRLLTAIAHAFSFWAWVSLADLGLSDDAAAGLMLNMVNGVVNSLNPK